LAPAGQAGLHATVCRHRFLSVRSICLASWSTGPRWAYRWFLGAVPVCTPNTD